ncbi:hypothetical protein JNUCC0626_48535 [Lentzea sp. JNUCC 0626]|uniref:hypothetical protein n=1 Tax=Lentzea sp. JNUCC 0626 TaxID=3367513 RepID=UPI0037498217
MTTTPNSRRDLVERAIAESRHRKALGEDRFDFDRENLPRKVHRSFTIGRIADQLLVNRVSVAVTDDPDRRYGISRPEPGDLITITDPGTPLVLRFVPDFTALDRRWLLLDECPDCGGVVPMARVARLADLGDHLDPDKDALLDELPAEYYGDPAHRKNCSHSISSPEEDADDQPSH